MTSAGNRLAKYARTVEAKKSLPTEGDWEWGGCGDNVNFGFRKSREFMDAPYRKRSDIKTLVKLHNNDAGRLVSLATSFQFLAPFGSTARRPLSHRNNNRKRATVRCSSSRSKSQLPDSRKRYFHKIRERV